MHPVKQPLPSRLIHFLAVLLCLTSLGQSFALLKEAHVKRSYGKPGIDQTFDYVIVGGGTAGLTIAARLSADPSLSVAVIEAGGFYEDAGNSSVVPGYDALFAGTDPKDTNPKVDWGYVTVPQKGANGRRMHYASGKCLGGSSARNFMYYHRQTVGSSAKWASDVGDKSYQFTSLLPFYEKSVKWTPPVIQYTNTTNPVDANVFNSGGGPLQVSYGGYNDPFGTWALPAFQAVGQKQINGFSSGRLIGSGYVAETIDTKTGKRSSSETSFLQSAIGYPTLTVYNNTLAHKILFNGTIASGVAVSQDGTPDAKQYTLSARKEVIVSAGTFRSPQLLMVSGIGPRKTLEGLGIKVLKDLPGIGSNLWDQPYFGSSFRVNVPTASAAMNDPSLAAAAVEAFLTKGVGPLTNGGTGVIGWEKLPNPYRGSLSRGTLRALRKNFPADWPELEWLPVSAFFGYQTQYTTADPKDGFNYATLAVALVAPLSRGTVSISSDKMTDQPLIDPNWLSDKADQELAIASFKRQREIWTKMKDVLIGDEYFPGASVQSDDEILKFISQSVAPIWHAAATCKQGKANDPAAVVDSSNKVYGLQNLRVVDASSFPFLPPGHPQSTVYALAEKISAEILQHAQSRVVQGPIDPSR